MRWLRLLLALAVGTSLCQTCTLLHGQWQNVTVSVSGTDRRVLVWVPVAVASPPPLVVVYHGLTGTPEGISFYSKFKQLADTEGFVVGFPAGLWNSWNAGFAAPPANINGVDDVGFSRALVATLADLGCTDPLRVYATGMSNGGFMCYRLACQASDVFAAIVPDAGLMGDWLAENPNTNYFTCTPGRRVPVLHWHGTADTAVMYNGTVSVGSVVTAKSVPETFKAWSTRNGCNADAITVSLVKGNWNCTSAQCQSPADNVTLCTVQGLGHTWVANSEPFSWGFMKRFSLPLPPDSSSSSSSSSSTSLASPSTLSSSLSPSSSFSSSGNTPAVSSGSSSSQNSNQHSTNGATHLPAWTSFGLGTLLLLLAM